MARALRIFGLSLSLLVASPLGGVALAGEPSPQQLQYARDLFAEAQKHERDGNWQAALDSLNKIAGIKLTPGVQYHLALCKEKLGMLVEAFRDYQAAERDAQQQNVQDVLQAVKGPLAALREKVARLKVTVSSEVKDAKVTVDGAPLDAASFGTEIPVAPGDHRIEASAPGRAPFDGKVPAKPGEIVVVPVILPRVGGATSPVPVPAPASSNADANAPSPAEAPPPADEPTSPGKPSRTGVIIATGSAVFLVAAGIAAFAIADGKQTDARDQCAHQTSCDDLRGPVRTWDTVALGAWIGGAVAGAIAVVLWLKPSKSDASSAFMVGPGVVRGSF